MANQEQAEILLRGVETWNQWREENPRKDIDLSNIDLRPEAVEGKGGAHPATGRAHLNGAHLEEANLSEANLSEADLSGAYLRGADLSRANLHRADLVEAYLTGANLSGASVKQTQIEAARGDERTLLPPGMVRPKHWATEDPP